MDKQREEEFLLHIAADTDPLTALAALPRESDEQGEPQPPTQASTVGVVWAVLIVIAILVLWWLTA